MFQRPALAIGLLLLATAFAGCVKEDPAPPETNTTSTGATTPATTTPTTGGNGTGQTPPANPAPVTDKGTIQGPFEKTWTISVPAISPEALTIQFNLTGVQAGAPATASVYLVFSGPDGAAIKTGTVGAGAAEKVSWVLTGAEVPQVGDYTLKATAQPSPLPVPGGLPSGGVANYDLLMMVEY